MAARDAGPDGTGLLGGDELERHRVPGRRRGCGDLPVETRHHNGRPLGSEGQRLQPVFQEA